MPKIVDHDAQREQLAEAAGRTIAQRGIEGATMRAVAEEAGCSTGPLVHYFGDKVQLLVHALRHNASKVAGRMLAHLRAAGGITTLRSVLEEALPLDADRRAEWRVWLSFWGRAAAEPQLAAEQSRRYEQWRELVGAALRSAQARGELLRGLDFERIAEELVALVDGIAIQAMFEPDRFPRSRQLAIVDRLLESISATPTRENPAPA